MFKIILTDLLCNIQRSSVASGEDSEKCTSDEIICRMFKNGIFKWNLSVSDFFFHNNVIILQTVVEAWKQLEIHLLSMSKKYGQPALKVWYVQMYM